MISAKYVSIYPYSVSIHVSVCSPADTSDCFLHLTTVARNPGDGREKGFRSHRPSRGGMRPSGRDARADKGASLCVCACVCDAQQSLSGSGSGGGVSVCVCVWPSYSSLCFLLLLAASLCFRSSGWSYGERMLPDGDHRRRLRSQPRPCTDFVL